jgi:uncharacterized MnhB-related membrane protein
VTDPSPTPSKKGGWSLSEGVPIALFALLALVATVFGRLLSPALFGSGTGLDRWIMAAQALGNVSSQAVAAGGVAFALRAVGVALGKSGLGIAYRMVVIPAVVVTSALAMRATGHALEPELASALAISAIVGAAAGAPIALSSPASRALGLVLGLTAVAGAADFAGLSLAASAIEKGSPGAYRMATVLSTIGFVLELGMLVVAIAFVTAGNRIRAAVLGGVSALVAALLVYMLHAANGADASTTEIVVARAASTLLRSPPPYVPAAARLMLEVGGFVAALAAIFMTRKSPLAPLIALCLTARGSPDVPIPALLLVVASIAVPAYAVPSRAPVPSAS